MGLTEEQKQLYRELYGLSYGRRPELTATPSKQVITESTSVPPRIEDTERYYVSIKPQALRYSVTRSDLSALEQDGCIEIRREGTGHLIKVNVKQDYVRE